MPRGKKPPQDMLEDAHGNPIMPAIVIRHPGAQRHERHPDAYLALEGGAQPVEDKPKPRKRRTQRQQIQEDLVVAQTHAKARGRRFDLYLDALGEFHGNRVAALAAVYKMSELQVVEQYDELLADVQRGRMNASIAEILDDLDANQTARVKVLRTWMYSGNPAASINAIKLLDEADDDSGRSGNLYEHYIRAVLDEDDA